jgi:AraC family transcriptional regulator, ethanolamine operon transcriptional activator
MHELARTTTAALETLSEFGGQMNDRPSTKISKPTAFPVLRSAFSDLREMCASHPMLNLSYVQLGRGQFRGEFFGFPLPHGMFWRSRVNLAVEGESDIPDDYTMVALSSGGEETWHDQVVGPSDLALGYGPLGLKHRTSPDHEAWVWLLEYHRYLKLADALGLQVRNLCTLRLFQDVHPQSIQRLRNTIADFLAVAEQSPELTTAQVNWFENALVRRTLHCLENHKEPSEPCAPSSRSIAVAARDCLHANCDSPLCITTLCLELNVRERTLREHFTRFYQTSPTAYHLALRLNRVRQRLMVAEPTKGAVSQAATESGFWHMGRFAKHYRRHFGESPTATVLREAVTDCEFQHASRPLDDALGHEL